MDKLKAESHLATTQSSETADHTSIYICLFGLITTTAPAVTGNRMKSSATVSTSLVFAMWKSSTFAPDKVFPFQAEAQPASSGESGSSEASVGGFPDAATPVDQY